MAKKSGVMIRETDAYIAKAAPFAQPILKHLRAVVHEGAPAVVEEMKWSRPFFVYEGVILGNMSAFKSHCSFGLWGAEMAQQLRAEGVAGRPAAKEAAGELREGGRAEDRGGREDEVDRQAQTGARGEGGGSRAGGAGSGAEEAQGSRCAV